MVVFPEYTTGTVASALRRLLRDGRVYRVSKGVYAVTELPTSILALIKQRGPMKGRDISKALNVKRSVSPMPSPTWPIPGRLFGNRGKCTTFLPW